MRILIVDDSEIARTGLKFLLAGHEGCEVCGEANDGKQGIIKAIDLNPDLIILDYSMAGMDGLHVAQEISKAVPKAWILICTLFPSHELEVEALKVGVRQVISKSEMSKGLISVIDNIRNTPKSDFVM
jgi:two-component system, NarL family, response regulator NreC